MPVMEVSYFRIRGRLIKREHYTDMLVANAVKEEGHGFATAVEGHHLVGSGFYGIPQPCLIFPPVSMQSSERRTCHATLKRGTA
jgi:hypothetical protein